MLAYKTAELYLKYLLGVKKKNKMSCLKVCWKGSMHNVYTRTHSVNLVIPQSKHSHLQVKWKYYEIKMYL